MRNFFKIIYFCLIFAVVLLLCSCSTDSSIQNKDNSKIDVIVTAFPQYDFVRQIAGDKVNLRMLISPGSEVHTFEPSPKDMADIFSCDLFIYNGGESDAWLNQIIGDIPKEVTMLSFFDHVTLLESYNENGETDHSHDSHDSCEHSYDEHVWTSPQNAMILTQKIKDTLCNIDVDNSKAYEENYKDYLVKLTQLDNSFKDLLSTSKRKTIVIGDRFPFLYLANHYGLEYFAAFPGCASNTEVSISKIASLTDKVKQEKIPVIFEIEFSNGKIAKNIAEETGAKVLLLHSCHNVTLKEFESGETYTSLMDGNLKNLTEALN